MQELAQREADKNEYRSEIMSVNRKWRLVVDVYEWFDEIPQVWRTTITIQVLSEPGSIIIAHIRKYDKTTEQIEGSVNRLLKRCARYTDPIDWQWGEG